MIQITKERYKELLQAEDTLNEAYAAGVDNWDGWMSWVPDEDEDDEEE